MTKAEKVGAIILAFWCTGWLAFSLFFLPAY